MTEAYEDGLLVRVRAQVMCRDEATGGWVALGGGGLANVCVGRRPRTEGSPEQQQAATFDYFISGVRISDTTELLSCTIKKDFQYNKVMPTFHHWVTDEKRFGLTFQTAADARAFDRGVRSAIDQLLDGLGGAWPALHAFKADPSEEDDEGNIFECLHLPSESRSSSSNSCCSRRAPTTTVVDIATITHPHAHETSLKHYGMSGDEEKTTIEETNPDHCSYVHLTAVHEYMYPKVTSGVISPDDSSPNTKPPLLSKDSGSIKKRGVTYGGSPPPLPDKKTTIPSEAFQARLKCRHCHEWYLESANRAGACEFAPDCCRSCVDAVSCIKCAQCMLYHCMSDAEGDFASHPCSCATPDHACAQRWVGLSLLSLVVPCLCCYLPLRGAHRAARAAHLAGGLHAPTHPTTQGSAR